MNKVVLIGRLTKDPEVITTGTGSRICRFDIATTRRYAKSDGTRETDFLPCVVFGKTVDFMEKYFHKGDPIAIDGEIHIDKMEKDGQNKYYTSIVCDRVEFVPGAKKQNESQNNQSSEQFSIPDEVEDGTELPF